jgi:hypothetical protein
LLFKIAVAVGTIIIGIRITLGESVIKSSRVLNKITKAEYIDINASVIFESYLTQGLQIADCCFKDSVQFIVMQPYSKPSSKARKYVFRKRS